MDSIQETQNLEVAIQCEIEEPEGIRVLTQHIDGLAANIMNLQQQFDQIQKQFMTDISSTEATKSYWQGYLNGYKNGIKDQPCKYNPNAAGYRRNKNPESQL